MMLALSGISQANDNAAHAMTAEYAGSFKIDALLEEPRINAELQHLLGTSLPHLEHNIRVNGGINVISGILAVSGNAPHKGTEEEAIVCINPYNTKVDAAIFSKDAITIFSREQKYENLPVCIKDWITQTNSGHIDRLKQPANARMHPVNAAGQNAY